MKPLPERLEALRVARRETWKGLAAALGIGEVMIHYLRKGARGASFKLEDRIIEAERAAGLLPDEPVRTAPNQESNWAKLTSEQKASMVFDPPELHALHAKVASMESQLAELRAELAAGRMASDKMISDLLEELRSRPPAKSRPK